MALLRRDDAAGFLYSEYEDRCGIAHFDAKRKDKLVLMKNETTCLTRKTYFCSEKGNFFGREGLVNRDSCVIKGV